ncbi:MAG: amino acid adenylation domain-containing protein, partial [Gammaproteobacteria bacterium]|nr:amino acid adenylation domain-containing protein [Gammaproteobacteria bacterium]
YHLAVDPEETFTDHLRKTREACFDSFRHQDIPFDQVVRAINPPRDTSRTPLYQVFFGYQDQRGRDFDFGEIRIEPYEADIEVARTDLTLWVEHDDEGLSLALEYCTDLFERSTAGRILDHFENLISLSAERPESPIWQLNPLSESDRALQLATNQTARDFPYSDALSLLLDSARQHSDKTAIVFEDEQVSYAQLMQRSAAIAGLLEQEGLQPGSIVGIYMDRSPQMVASIIGIWMAGCAYLPLDPGLPLKRLEYMLADSSTRVLITQESLIESTPEFTGQTVSVDRSSGAISDCPTSTNEYKTDPQTLAYVLYTSGSTGWPKGVMVPHSCVVNFLSSMAREPGLSTEDRLVAVTTTSFDISVLELFLPLTVGARVIIASSEAATYGAQLKSLLEDSEATVMQATPATWRMLLDAGWKGGPTFKALCGGESMPQDLAWKLNPVCGELWNLYGPTETTIWSSCAQIMGVDSPITIGRPIANTQVYVLDENQQLQSMGVPGELYIAGAGVSLGYINQPSLTSAAFTRNPFSDDPDSRLYRTGDLVRWRNDGTLQHLGRIDAQIKIRGFRIELGEIEAVLAEHDAVKAVACNVWQAAADDHRLVAYIVPADEKPLVTTELRNHLRGKLPDYMVPQYFEQIESIPLTANGKVDRKALADLGASQSLTSEYVEPVTETERKVARIWSEFLQIEKVSTNQCFFDIGGHSLLAINVIQKIDKEFGVRISPRDMMLNTLQEIANTLA